MNDADSPELEKSGMEPELGGLHKGLSEDRQLAELLNDDRLVAGSFSHTKNWEPIRGNKRMKARLMSLVEDDIQEDKVRVLAARLMGFISYKDFAVVQVLGRALSDSDVKWEESTAGEKGWRLRTNLVSEARWSLAKMFSDAEFLESVIIEIASGASGTTPPQRIDMVKALQAARLNRRQESIVDGYMSGTEES